jgi:hypothetical protein
MEHIGSWPITLILIYWVKYHKENMKLLVEASKDVGPEETQKTK